MAAGTYPSSWSAEAVASGAVHSGGAVQTAPSQPPLQLQWATLCALLVIPFAAILHHAIFYPAQCMLNSFGSEYSLAVVKTWLSRDPSLLGASLIAVGVYRLGLSWKRVHNFTPAFLLAFLPLSIWIWDIPFAGRWICENFHDLQIHLPGDVLLRTRYLYLAGIVLFPALHLLMRRGTFAWPATALRSLRSQEG